MLILGAVTSLLMLFYAAYLWRCAWYFPPSSASVPGLPPDPPFLSVIVPARNEEANVAACLRALLLQDYPAERYEILLVNDHSEDRTVEIALETAGQSPRFRLLHLPGITGPAYKKAAVAHGIRAARGSIILTTDADCSMGPAWLRAMAARFGEGTGLVSGPVQLTGATVFQQFQALEFMGLIAVGAASIRAGNPNMCNGANLAYRRAAFDEVSGFSGIDHLASGDDELLMHKIASGTNWRVDFAGDREAIVRTAALDSWGAFRAQRLRWVSKSTHYKKASITLTLALSWLAMACLPVLLALGFWDGRAWLFLAGNLLLKMAGEFPILFRAAGFFDKLQLLRWFFPEQLAHIAYVLWVGLAANLRFGRARSYTWKGRQVK